MVKLNLQLPDEFFLEETRDGYTISSEMKKIWAVELDLLNEFSKVCTENDIKFYADGGTLLGAVRHGGFIPWDDDIDIVMKREEYEKLNQIAPLKFKPPYFWQTEITDPGSLRGHAQLRNSLTTGILTSELKYKYKFNQGIFIDVFPLDNIPDKIEEQKLLLKKLKRQKEKAVKYSYLTFRFAKDGSGLKSHIRDLYHRFLMVGTFKFVPYKEFEKTMTRYNQYPSLEIGKLFYMPLKEKYIWKSQWFESAILFPFEMLMLPVPVGYNEMLQKFYGNWEILIRGKSSHGYVFFDVETPYIEYIK